LLYHTGDASNLFAHTLYLYLKALDDINRVEMTAFIPPLGILQCRCNDIVMWALQSQPNEKETDLFS
jgi:hypothetical protein